MRTSASARPRGFTLIETILVIVVVGLAMTMVVRSMSRSLAASRTRSASQIVGADLEHAFTLAALQRRPVRIAWTPATMTYTITDRRNGTVYVTRVIGTGTGTDIGAGSATFSASLVDVFPGGTASSALTVTLTGGTSSHVVSMTRAGLVRVN